LSVAVLGTNEFEAADREAQQIYLSAVTRLALARIPIRTGASTGCDQIAAQAALEVGGRVELVLPWPRFQAQWVRVIRRKYPGRCQVEVFDRVHHAHWLESVARYARPGEDVVGWRTQKLYARVFGIVEPAEIVLAMPLVTERGGTGQGMRIARAMGKVVLDVRRPDDREQLYVWLKGLPH
jgi:hypothetical protein